MNWIKESANDLRNYNAKKHSVGSIEQRIKMLEDNIVALRSVGAEVSVSGGSGSKEESLINYIAEKERLRTNLEITKTAVTLINEALTMLDDKQRRLLDVFFINRPPNHIDVLCEELSVEKSTVYRLKDEALYRFTVAMYGIADL